MQRLRVLSIAHTAVTSGLGRRRYVPLARRPGLETHLLAPATWREFGRVIAAEPVGDFPLPLHLAPILLPQVPKMGWYLHVYPRLRKLLRTLDPDVIHLWEEPWSLVALQAVALRGRAGIVLEVDQNILKRLPPPFEAIRRWVLARTDIVLVRSPDAEAVVRACGFTGKSFDIGYGVDQEIFHSHRDPLAGGATPLRVSYVGRLLEEKGLDDVLEGMRRQTSATSLLTIQGDGPHKEALLKRVAKLGLGARVTFKGWASPADVAETYRQSDVSILVTRTTCRIKEQFGRAIIESQSCGVPVIGSTSGAIPSVLGDGGWIVSERAPHEIAALLDTLEHDRARIREAASHGLRNVAHRFTFDRVADALERAWTEAAAQAGARNGQRPRSSLVTSNM